MLTSKVLLLNLRNQISICFHVFDFFLFTTKASGCTNNWLYWSCWTRIPNESRRKYSHHCNLKIQHMKIQKSVSLLKELCHNHEKKHWELKRAKQLKDKQYCNVWRGQKNYEIGEKCVRQMAAFINRYERCNGNNYLLKISKKRYSFWETERTEVKASKEVYHPPLQMRAFYIRFFIFAKMHDGL